VTGENQPKDNIKRSKKKFDPTTETRIWKAVTSPEDCFKIAKKDDQKVVEIIDLEDELLPIICIFEDITYD
jgi:hypothetical protein